MQTVPKDISVDAITSHLALDQCKLAYKDFFKRTGYSGKMLVRHPGIIGIRGENQKLASLVDAINKEKQAFKEIVLTEKTKDARFELVHSSIPNLITLAFYRQLYLEKNPAYSVTFTWMHKHSIQQLTKAQALSFLQSSSQDHPLRSPESDAWIRKLEAEKIRINTLNSSEKLRIRRPIAVSPQVNVRFSASNRYHVSAALPFILLNAEQTEKIGKLPNYAKKADPRAKKSRYLIERLFLETT